MEKMGKSGANDKDKVQKSFEEALNDMYSLQAALDIKRKHPEISEARLLKRAQRIGREFAEEKIEEIDRLVAEETAASHPSERK